MYLKSVTQQFNHLHTWTLSEPALFKSNGSRILSTQSTISNLKILKPQSIITENL